MKPEEIKVEEVKMVDTPTERDYYIPVYNDGYGWCMAFTVQLHLTAEDAANILKTYNCKELRILKVTLPI